MKDIQTLGQLKTSNYKFRPIKAEMAENLGRILTSGDPVIPGIHGYEDTVMPQLYH
ncbi:MAG TPA: magnesium chelatase, partial [Leptospiraceae bacterium]|nr:magnesium chelatase [Leptospiraceae bacterium]